MHRHKWNPNKQATTKITIPNGMSNIINSIYWTFSSSVAIKMTKHKNSAANNMHVKTKQNINDTKKL